MNSNKETLKEIIDKHSNIVILSGAGVSTDSNIPDFRSQNGIYKSGEVEKYIHRNYYNANPSAFWCQFKKIFNDKIISDDYKPNIAHTFINNLINEGKNVKVFTQNIDGLYNKVLPKEIVYEMHGTLSKYHCPSCKKEYDINFTKKEIIPTCINIVNGELCDDILDVDVVLFGDTVRYFDDACESIDDADLVIVMGTSLAVYPFNTLIDNTTAKKILINNEPPHRYVNFDSRFYGNISDILNEVYKINE